MVDAQQLRDALLLDLTASERQRIRFLLGETNALPLGESADELRQNYDAEGIYAVMDANGGRGADFAKNQSQGGWAEGLLRAYRSDVAFINFGLSDPIDPSAPDYAAVRRKHRYILLAEGKRPDFLIFPVASLQGHPEIASWSEKLLDDNDREILRNECLAGAEIKSSLQHYGKRQQWRLQSGWRNISVTVKEEEFHDLQRWETDNETPIVICQVFVDSIWCVSYHRFMHEYRNKGTRGGTEPKTGKPTQMLEINNRVSRLAKISISEQDYSFRVDEKGAVLAPLRWPRAAMTDTLIPPLHELKTFYQRKAAAI